jgi:hypothetical protein
MWRFEETQEHVAGMQLRMVDVVLGGLRETAIDDLDRLARLDGMSFELTERGTRLKHELKKIFNERALMVISVGGSISDIEKMMGDRVQARIAVDSMLMCDAITARTAEVGMGAGAKQPRHRTMVGIGIIPQQISTACCSTRTFTTRRRAPAASRSSWRARRRRSMPASRTLASSRSRI